MLHEKLADIWPATRSRKVAAGVKVAVLIHVIASGPKSVALFSENTNELKTLKNGALDGMDPIRIIFGLPKTSEWI